MSLGRGGRHFGFGVGSFATVLVSALFPADQHVQF